MPTLLSILQQLLESLLSCIKGQRLSQLDIRNKNQEEERTPNNNKEEKQDKLITSLQESKHIE